MSLVARADFSARGLGREVASELGLGEVQSSGGQETRLSRPMPHQGGPLLGSKSLSPGQGGQEVTGL